jgi:hypothetical protein
VLMEQLFEGELISLARRTGINKKTLNQIIEKAKTSRMAASNF